MQEEFEELTLENVSLPIHREAERFCMTSICRSGKGRRSQIVGYNGAGKSTPRKAALRL